MYATPMSPQPLRLPHFFTHWIVGFVVACMLALASLAAHAAPPPAGTSISNQASATYTDASGVPRTVTSNVVQTTVQQVASLTLAANGAQSANPGSVVYYPHTLTNTGNGTDSFGLTTSNSGAFSMASVQIFADNGSGAPTGPAITSTGALGLGATFKFIVVGTLPGTATNGQTNTITVTGTSVFDNTKTAVNTDVTTVTSNAVITLTKAVSVATGPAPSGPYKYTLTYTNNGNSTATAVAITDVIPAGMVYVANSARWSVTGTTTLSDSGGSVGTSPNTLTSSYTIGTKTFLATLAQVTAGQSGTISFDVNVAAGTAPGVQNNTATSSYNNGTGPATGSGSSNVVAFTVTQTASVSFAGATVPGPAAPGQTVSFANVLTNSGNGTDTFNITLSAGNFPSGTTFQLFKSDGLTPLVDTNGDTIADTGPVAAGATYSVVLKATLPPTATNVGAPFIVNKTATSAFNSAVTAVAADQLSVISSASVDLTNTSPAGPGVGAGPEGAPVLTQAVNPGGTTTFTLVANNTGPSPDSYNLGASTVSSFASVALPTGWTVTFKADGGAGNCSTTGATITNTGSVPAAGNVRFCAVVTVPATGAGAAAGTTSLFFRVLSPTSGARDTINNAVTVNTIRAIALTPTALSGQTYPGGSVVYTHSLVNNGNVIEGGGAASSSMSLTSVNDQAGWTSTLYFDTNSNGVLDPLDQQITGNLDTILGAGGLAVGQSRTIFNKVLSPSGATPGAVDVSTITVTTSTGVYAVAPSAPAVAKDSTTVVAGNLTLVKAQALDAACDGTADTAYSGAVVSARPNQCVLYQMTVTNVGAADATSVVVSDSTPTYTKVSVVPAVVPGTIATGAPIVGGVGSFSANVGTGATASAGGTLAPGQSAVVTFGVRIDQ